VVNYVKVTVLIFCGDIEVNLYNKIVIININKSLCQHKLAKTSHLKLHDLQYNGFWKNKIFIRPI